MAVQGVEDDTMILVSKGRCFVKSDALIKLLVLKNGWSPWTKIALRVPRCVRNVAYDWFGLIRYQVFGKKPFV